MGLVYYLYNGESRMNEIRLIKTQLRPQNMPLKLISRETIR